MSKVPARFLSADLATLKKWLQQSESAGSLGFIAQPSFSSQKKKILNALDAKGSEPLSNEEWINVVFQLTADKVPYGTNEEYRWSLLSILVRFDSSFARIKRQSFGVQLGSETLPNKDSLWHDPSEFSGTELRRKVTQRDIRTALNIIAKSGIDELKRSLAQESLPASHRMAIYSAGILTTEQAAEFLGIDASLVRKYAREGRIGIRLSPRHIVFDVDELKAFSLVERTVGKHHS